MAMSDPNKFWGPKLSLDVPGSSFSLSLSQRDAVSSAREPVVPWGMEPSSSSPADCSALIRDSHPGGSHTPLENSPGEYFPGNQGLHCSFRIGSTLGIEGSDAASPDHPFGWVITWDRAFIQQSQSCSLIHLLSYC